MNAIRSMLALETAAGEWFSKMNEREQEAYRKAHPKSAFARHGVQTPPDTGERPTMGPYRMSMHVNAHEASPRGLAHTFQKRGFFTSLKPLRTPDGDATHRLSVHYHPHQATALHREMQRHGGDDVFGHDRLYNRLKRRSAGKPGRQPVSSVPSEP